MRYAGHEGKPEHGKSGLCQACYRRKRRRERGLQSPGPKPDPKKLYSRYGGRLTHHGPRQECINGHEFSEGSFKFSITGKRICLVCEDSRTHCGRGHRRTPETTYLWKGIRRCRVCRAEDAVWYHRLYKYNLSYDDIIDILEEQDYGCRICGRKLLVDVQRGFTIDHDHDCCSGEYTCGKCVRAILCDPCNKGLGWFEDNPDRLRAATDYVEHYRVNNALILSPRSRTSDNFRFL